MIAPEGYWTWTETVEAASSWTLDVHAASTAPEVTVQLLEAEPNKCRAIFCKKLIDSKKVENQAEASFAIDLLELWLLANFMDTFDAVLCSPDGRTLQCPPIIKAHGDAFDWWSWPLSSEKIQNGEAHGYFDNFRNGKFNIWHARSRFCALNYHTGIIELKPNTVGLLSSASYTHGDNSAELLQFIDAHIRPLVGWSICWNPEDIPETTQELYESLGFGSLNWEAFADNSKVGKPKLPPHQNILDCVLAALPDGKVDLTWKEVVAKVGYSRRSIRRALEYYDRYSDWATSKK